MRIKLFILALAIGTNPIITHAQTLTPEQKAEIKTLTCAMVKQDQMYRIPPYSDSVARAYSKHDSLGVIHFGTLMTQSDTPNFNKVMYIMKTYGYPGEKLMGKEGCNITTIINHWSTEYPEWFNDPKTVALFKKEVTSGNLPRYTVDYALYTFVVHTAHDLEFFEPINATRKAVGLPKYTEKQFMREEKIEAPKP